MRRRCSTRHRQGVDHRSPSCRRRGRNRVRGDRGPAVRRRRREADRGLPLPAPADTPVGAPGGRRSRRSRLTTPVRSGLVRVDHGTHGSTNAAPVRVGRPGRSGDVGAGRPLESQRRRVNREPRNAAPRPRSSSRSSRSEIRVAADRRKRRYVGHRWAHGLLTTLVEALGVVFVAVTVALSVVKRPPPGAGMLSVTKAGAAGPTGCSATRRR
jgi:hypothetical protein